MGIADDFHLDPETQEISYVGQGTSHSVVRFHHWLMHRGGPRRRIPGRPHPIDWPGGELDHRRDAARGQYEYAALRQYEFQKGPRKEKTD